MNTLNIAYRSVLVLIILFFITKMLGKKDLKLKTKDNALVANLIIDGKILDTNLKCINKNKEWLLHELKIKGYNVSDVLLATLDNKNKFTIYRKKINPDKNTILE